MPPPTLWKTLCCDASAPLHIFPLQACISTRIDYPVFMMDVKVSRDKYISRWVDWENLIYVTRTSFNQLLQMVPAYWLHFDND